MPDHRVALIELIEKGADGDLVREMRAVAAPAGRDRYRYRLGSSKVGGAALYDDGQFAYRVARWRDSTDGGKRIRTATDRQISEVSPVGQPPSQSSTSTPCPFRESPTKRPSSAWSARRCSSRTTSGRYAAAT